MVTAHEIGQFVYCREAWRLAALGCTPSVKAQHRMRAGEREHDRWQRREDRRSGHHRARRRRALVLLLVALFILVWAWVNDGPSL